MGGARVRQWQFCVARAFLLHPSPASFELHAAVAALQNGSMSASAAAVIQRFLETAELYHPYASVEFCTQPWPVLCQECTTQEQVGSYCLCWHMFEHRRTTSGK